MSKSVEEVRRAAFEAALRRDWAEHLVALDREGGGYVFGDINAAWWAFNAAVDAVEIQLPGLVGLDQPFTGTPISEIRAHNHYNQALEDCRAAIEQTGLGLKVLP